MPAIYAGALPSGAVEPETFRGLTDPMLEAARQGPIAGVWLYLHGAMEVAGLDSGETWLVGSLRKLLGPDFTIAAALDFHANLTQGLVAAAGVIRGYRTAPHTDPNDTQLAVPELLVRCLREALLPHPVMVRVPMVSPGDALVTTIEPGRTLMAKTLAAEQREGILCAFLLGGQPWVDASNVGQSVVVTPPGPPALAWEEAGWRRATAPPSPWPVRLRTLEAFWVRQGARRGAASCCQCRVLRSWSPSGGVAWCHRRSRSQRRLVHSPTGWWW